MEEWNFGMMGSEKQKNSYEKVVFNSTPNIPLFHHSSYEAKRRN
jgi:hypothetical protein